MSVDTYLATLRDWIGDPEDYSDEDRGAAERACDACDGVEAELSRLREQITELLQQESFMERKMAAQREDIERLAARVEAAEARCARLQQALDPETLARQFHETYERLAPEFGYETRRDSAVPWEQVPAANRAPMVAVATEIAREVLAGPDAQTSGSGSSAADPSAGERQGRQPDPGEIAGLLVELSRWSRVAELNGDLHARIASALAVPDTPDYRVRFVWLIERGQSLNHAPTVWLCQEKPYDFSPDPLRAIRYPTREAAEAVIAEHTVGARSPWAVAVEHGFADTPADSQEDGWFIPEGDRRCGVVHMDARATCMKRRGHDGPHASAMGHWIDGPWCEQPADRQEES